MYGIQTVVGRAPGKLIGTAEDIVWAEAKVHILNKTQHWGPYRCKVVEITDEEARQWHTEHPVLRNTTPPARSPQ